MKHDFFDLPDRGSFFYGLKLCAKCREWEDVLELANLLDNCKGEYKK